MRSRPEASAGIEKSGRGSRAPNQIQKFILPPELSPNFWLPVQHFFITYELPERLLRLLRLAFGSGDCEGMLEVVAVMCEDGGRLRRDFEVGVLTSKIEV